MATDPSRRVLVHFTKHARTVGSILERGLLLIHSDRGLIREFVDDPAFEKKEPQEFGMTSFTELGLSDLTSHRSIYGDFGIAVDLTRAVEKGAQRVIYVPSSGPIFEAFRWLFRLGFQELQDMAAKRGGFGMAYTSKAMARVGGAHLWATLLTLYEYFQPEPNAGEVEWRIVNKSPLSHPTKDKSEIIKTLLNMPEAWLRSMGSVPLEPYDVLSLVCPAERKTELGALLPERFRDVAITSSEREDAATAVLTKLVEIETPPAPEIVRAEPPEGPLVPLGPVTGFQLFFNMVRTDSCMDLFFRDADDVQRRVRIPLENARFLLRLLAQAAQDPRFPQS